MNIAQQRNWKQRIKDAKVSRNQIARETGLHPITLHLMFNGVTKNSYHANVAAIEQAIKKHEKEARKKNYRRGENALLTHAG